MRVGRSWLWDLQSVPWYQWYHLVAPQAKAVSTICVGATTAAVASCQCSRLHYLVLASTRTRATEDVVLVCTRDDMIARPHSCF